MDQISTDALYEERGEVSWARPLLQGDVFDGIILPGFGEEPMKVQIINHPCAMRVGANLLPRITVAPVVSHSVVVGERGWNGNLRIMPLSELWGGDNFATKFIDVTAAPLELLTRSCRIATLSHQGIYVLQQRLIKHYTRVEMPLELLRNESAAVLAEAEMQWFWVEEVLTDLELKDESLIESEANAFDAWLSDGEPKRRNLLKQEIQHADLRRQAQRASRSRSQLPREQR